MSMSSVKDKIIQLAWEDTAFKERLLASPKEAIQEAFQVSLPEGMELSAVEETSSRLFLVIPTNPATTLASSDKKVLAGRYAPWGSWEETTRI